ncbi:MAG TPA: ribosome small subunit-dependent GTPase A [Bacteroidales bacterium]|nr:ribosome small subunit-dependent GTPase A [Bacteroidales bacterium]HSA42809.1 ribosome small subunit-dependent GTPase A [Bacteroidales bacterium]
MTLEDLGYHHDIEAMGIAHKLQGFETGRIMAEHKERYIVGTACGECEAAITGNMRFTAASREDFPAVGDWVALTTYESGNALIHHVYPRSSVLRRQLPGSPGEAQIIAANIDIALLVQAAGRDFNINRLERYLTICHSSGVRPLIVLSKTDLCDRQRINEIRDALLARVRDVPVIPLSNATGEGIDDLLALIEKGKTHCLLGSSGVGKSSLLNRLAGQNIMKTGDISQTTQKGKHVTSHRELIILGNGAILIDNPGMREIGLTDEASGLETTFDNIIRLSVHCRYSDCSHTSETGCAVTSAVEKGEISPQAYDNFLKMQRETAHYEATSAQKRQKDKSLSKLIKHYKRFDP